MTFLSEIAPLSPAERASFGVARAKSLAFDAVHALWRRRRAEGKSQADLARTLDKDEGWLSKNLRGPGNWTMKTFGELVEALDGDLEIIVHAIEDPISNLKNSHAYAGYEVSLPAPKLSTSQTTILKRPGAPQVTAHSSSSP
jgi:hypothetical protein